MTIEDFLRLLMRNVVLLVLGLVIGAAAGYGYSYTKPEVYSASALGYVSASAQSDESGNPIEQASGNMQFQYSKAQSYLPLFKTRAVGETIVKKLDLHSNPDAVAGSLETVLDPNAPIITVTAFAGTSKEASAIANAAVEAAAKEAHKLETGGNEDAPVSVQLTNYQSAVVPAVPVSPDRLKYLLAGVAAGLLVGLALAWMRDRNDSRIRTADDITEAVNLPVLGVLPVSKELRRETSGRLPEPKSFGTREAIRKLRTSLRYVDVDHPPRSILVTSSAPGEGKSMVAGNLSRVMARAGYPTLLIDADLRRPIVADQFATAGSVGLSQLLAGSVTLDDAVQPTSTRLLSLLPAGHVPPNPSELLGSDRMKALIDELSRRYFVIIDAPPVLAVTDAQLLAHHADGAILVAVPGQTSSVALSRSVDAIHAVGAKVYGAVINRAPTGRFTRLAYGDTEYGYGSYGESAYGVSSAASDDRDSVFAEPVGGRETLPGPSAEGASVEPQSTSAHLPDSARHLRRRSGSHGARGQARE